MNAIIAQSASFALSVLVNGLWQGALLSAAAWLVLRAVRGTNATTRHAVLVAALAGILILPVVTTVAAFAGHAATLPEAVDSSDASSALHAHNGARSAAVAPSHQHAVSQRATHASNVSPNNVASSKAAAGFGPLSNLHFTLPPLLILIVALVWLVCALALAARLATSLLYLERLKRDALPLPVDYRARLERWDAALKGTRDVRLCRSPDVTVPIAVGIFDAMILLPEHLLDELQPEDLDRILLHELAHLRRGDDWINALERVAEALLFFNPAVRWIVRQLDVEREVACDDWVLERRNEALPYAQCLVKLVERVTWPHQALVAPGVFVTRRSISIRIERLMLKQRDVRLRIAPAPLSAVAALAIAVCFLGAYVAPSIAATPAAVSPASDGLRLASKPKTADRTSGTVATNKQAPVSGKVWAGKPSSANAHSGASRGENVTTVANEASRGSTLRNAQTGEKPAASALQAATKLGALTRSQPPVATMKQKVVVQLRPLGAQGALNVTSRTASSVALGAAKHTATQTTQSTETDSADGSDPVAAETSAGGAKRVAVNSDYISDLASAGYTNLSVDDLIRLKALGVTADYIRAMEGIGFNHPTIEELTRMRALDFTPEYARDIRKAFPSAPLDELLSMRAVGVSSQYVQELHDAGFSQLTPNSVRSLRALGVTGKYVQALRTAGVGPLTLENVRTLRAVGVDAAYVKVMADAGYAHLSAEQLAQLRAVGVDKAFLATVQSHGFHNLTLDQLVRLRTSGVLTND